MIRKHKSSISTFLGIYLAVTLVIGGAMFMLYRSNRKAHEKLEAEVVAAIVAKEEAEKDAAKKKQEEEKAKAVALAKKKEEQAKAKPKPDPPVAKMAPVKEAPVKKAEMPKTPTVSELDKELEAMYPTPEIRPLLEIVGNWKAIPLNAYPPFVNIRVPVEFDIRRGTTVIGKGKLPVGASMIPVNLIGDTLVLTNSRNSGISVKLPVGDTNFREKIKEKYDAFVKKQNADALAKRKAEKERRLGVIAAETALSEYNDGKDARFDPVKASIRRGEAGFYQIESAGKWRWAGQEVIEQEKYDVAFVIMIAESAFGVTEKELKALIKGGKVVSWIDVASGKKL